MTRPVCNEEIAFFSTTAKQSSKTNKLPEKMILGKPRMNHLFSSEEDTRAFFLKEGFPNQLFIDIEKKQSFDLRGTILDEMEHAGIDDIVIHSYKPNDVTLEAADLLIAKLTKDNLVGKNILIFGAGNLGAKLAIRLAERNANVSIWNIDEKSAQLVIEGINLFLPKFAPKITFYQEEENFYDLAISFISAEKVIDTPFLTVMKERAVVIDGGISNFTSNFISASEIKDIQMLRLDVRMADEYLAYTAQARLCPGFYETSIGYQEIDGIKIVSGGIIGRYGEIVVDSHSKPTRIIGIANGLGGLLHAEEYTEQQRANINFISTKIV